MAGAGVAAPFTFKGGTYPGTGGTCSASLAAAGTCTVVVTYSPVTIAIHTNTVVISYNDGVAAQTSSRPLQGTGVSAAILTISDGATYDYGTKATGSSTDKTL